MKQRIQTLHGETERTKEERDRAKLGNDHLRAGKGGPPTLGVNGVGEVTEG